MCWPCCSAGPPDRPLPHPALTDLLFPSLYLPCSNPCALAAPTPSADGTTVWGGRPLPVALCCWSSAGVQSAAMPRPVPVFLPARLPGCSLLLQSLSLPLAQLQIAQVSRAGLLLRAPFSLRLPACLMGACLHPQHPTHSAAALAAVTGYRVQGVRTGGPASVDIIQTGAGQSTSGGQLRLSFVQGSPSQQGKYRAGEPAYCPLLWRHRLLVRSCCDCWTLAVPRGWCPGFSL